MRVPTQTVRAAPARTLPPAVLSSSERAASGEGSGSIWNLLRPRARVLKQDSGYLGGLGSYGLGNTPDVFVGNWTDVFGINNSTISINWCAHVVLPPRARPSCSATCNIHQQSCPQHTGVCGVVLHGGHKAS